MRTQNVSKYEELINDSMDALRAEKQKNEELEAKNQALSQGNLALFIELESYKEFFDLLKKSNQSLTDLSHEQTKEIKRMRMERRELEERLILIQEESKENNRDVRELSERIDYLKAENSIFGMSIKAADKTMNSMEEEIRKLRRAKKEHSHKLFLRLATLFFATAAYFIGVYEHNSQIQSKVVEPKEEKVIDVKVTEDAKVEEDIYNIKKRFEEIYSN